MRQFTVDRFVISKGRTETTTFDDEHAAMWFAVDLSLHQVKDNWVTVIQWVGHHNRPGSLPDICWSSCSLRKVDQGHISYVNIHG